MIGEERETNMTYMERMMVRRGHPDIIVGIVGFSWVIYFLWQHNWVWAVAVVILSTEFGQAVHV